MQKSEKQEFVTEFNKALKDSDFLLVADYKGLNVLEICKKTSIFPHFIAPVL